MRLECDSGRGNEDLVLAIKRAEEIFKGNFFGTKAISVFEEKCRLKGIDVEFAISRADSLDMSSLEDAEADKAKGKKRLVFLHPNLMIFKVGGLEISQPVNILNLRELFKTENDYGVSYNNNPFGDGPVFDAQDSFNATDFARQPIKARYSFSSKDIIPGSQNKTWLYQWALLEPGERRREAVEAIWEALLYYSNTGKNIFDKNYWDWTNSQVSPSLRVDVGSRGKGIHISAWNVGIYDADLGVYSTR